VYVADDESPHISRGERRSNALLLLLIAVGGAYGALIVAARLSPQIAASVPWHMLGMNGPELPFVAQVASALAGLAALVMVLSRAVREVDKHPYASIAPVLAVFSGLLHSGLRVDLSAWGLSGTQLAVLVLALALLGGVLVGNGRLGVRLFGWALVVVPPALVVVMVAGRPPSGATSAPSALGMSSEHLFLVLLVGSSLLLGVAGLVARRLVGHARGAQPGDLDTLGWTGSDLNADMPVEYPGRRRFASGSGFTRSMQVSAAVVVVAAGAYVAVDRLKHGASESSAGFASSPVGAPVIEQLDPAVVARAKEEAAAAAQQKRQRPVKQSAARGAASHAALGERTPPPQPAAKSFAPVKHASAPARNARSAPAQASSASKGLPAWGAVATREFSNPKASSATTTKAAPPAANKRSTPISTDWGAPVAAKPAPVSAKQAPVAAAPEPATPRAAAQPVASSGRNAIPPPFSRPVAPPAPPPKEENLTVDQLVNRVVGAARENRVAEGKGAHGPKSEKDNELEALLDEAMKGSSKAPKKK
jgi:hypothetical protein